MPSTRSVPLLAIMAMLLLALPGCVETVAPARPLTSASRYIATDLAVAIQGDGTKHYVWTDCLDRCSVVYFRTKMGEEALRLEFNPLENESYLLPDIAVLDSGVAYLVWRSLIAGGSFNLYRDYYAEIPVKLSETPARRELAAPETSWAEQDSPPQVEARGNRAYAVFEIPEADGSSLRYRQLAGGNSSGYVVQNTTAGTRNYYPSLEIDADGWLHVAWLQVGQSDSPQHIIRATNRGTGGDMEPIQISPEAIQSEELHRPDTAITEDGRIYVVYGYSLSESSSDDINYVAIPPPYDMAALQSLTMNTADGWHVNGRVRVTDGWRLTGSGDGRDHHPGIAFSARNNSTSDYELFYATNSAEPTPVTNNSIDDGEPTIAGVTVDVGKYPVAVWRTYTLSGKQRCYADTFIYYNNRTRQIAQGSGECSNGGGDTAAAGIWAGTIWRDTAAGSSRTVPWIDFNAHTSHVPVILR